MGTPQGSYTLASKSLWPVGKTIYCPRQSNFKYSCGVTKPTGRTQFLLPMPAAGFGWGKPMKLLGHPAPGRHVPALTQAVTLAEGGNPLEVGWGWQPPRGTRGTSGNATTGTLPPVHGLSELKRLCLWMPGIVGRRNVFLTHTSCMTGEGCTATLTPFESYLWYGAFF